MTGLVTTTAAGRHAAAEVACLGDTKRYDVRDLARAWAECDALVLFLATGAAGEPRVPGERIGVSACRWASRRGRGFPTNGTLVG